MVFGHILLCLKILNLPEIVVEKLTKTPVRLTPEFDNSIIFFYPYLLLVYNSSNFTQYKIEFQSFLKSMSNLYP